MTKKFAIGAAPLNLTTGDFATFATEAATAGYDIKWGTRTGTASAFVALPNQAAYTPTGNVTLYVQFTGKPVAITFNKNDGAITATTLTAEAAKWGEATGVRILPEVKTWTKIDLGYEYGGLANAAADPTATATPVTAPALAKDVGAWVAQPTDIYAATKTLYVFWAGKPYTLSFAGGTDATGSQAEVSGTWPTPITVPATTTFVKDGFEFSNWMVETGDISDTDSVATNGVQWRPATYPEPYVNPILTAKWIAKTYTVTFNANGADSGTANPATETANWGLGVALAEVGTMVKDGYTFSGWATTDSATAALSGPTWTPLAGTAYAASLPLYAVWTPKPYTVTFNANGGLGAADHETSTVNWGSAVTLTAQGTLARNGYTFSGWATTDSATTALSGTTWTPTGTYRATYDLYAVWVGMPYTVTFNANGADSGEANPATSTVNWGSAVTLAAQGTLAKNGYAVSGWATTNSATTVLSGTTWTPTGAYEAAYTLYAVWITAYTVTFNANRGTGTASPGTSTVTGWGSAVTLAAQGTLARNGYTFSGWATTNSATTALSGTTWTPTGAYQAAYTLYAVWTLNAYTVTFNANGGTGAAAPETSAAYWGSWIALATVGTIVRDGYTFAGWSTTATGMAIFGTGWMATGTYQATYILYAVWTPNPYTVSFNANGGTGIAQYVVLSTSWGSAVDLSGVGTLAKNGYTFAGWSSTITGTPISGTTWTPTSGYQANYTLYAVWTSNTYTVTFNANGADSGAANPAISTANWGSAVALAAQGTLARYGYTFSGWATTDSATTVLSGTAWTPTGTYQEDYILYAVWTGMPYTVTFNANGGTGAANPATITANWGSAVSLAAVGTLARNGYDFIGWTQYSDSGRIGGTTWTPNGTYQAAYILYAVWSLKTYQVTFDANGATTGIPYPSPYYVAFWGSPVPLATQGTLAKSGYDFIGWAATDSATTALPGTTWTATGTYQKNFTLYAVWVGKSYTVNFNTNGGTGGTVATSITATWPASITLPTTAGASVAAPAGKSTFAGWGASSSTAAADALTGTWKPGSFSTPITLWAVWR